ncbi:hypothetical protein MKW92_038349 [Papaver armeniacum]|nr:hypothetical protein MKW92_038349 [Papaver armeniacum]
MTENSMRKKVIISQEFAIPVVNGLPQTPGLGKVVVKVHNEDLSKENYRVLVKYGKKPAALVPVPVPKSDIEMVKDAVGTQLGGDILITIGCGVFNSVTNNTLNVSVDDITRFCMRNFFHQKPKEIRFLSIQRMLQSMASSSTKLTLDLITWLNKANASLFWFLILRSKQHHWVLMVINFSVRKAWLLDPLVANKEPLNLITLSRVFFNILNLYSYASRALKGCLQVGKGNSSFSFYEEKCIPRQENHCESGFYIMRYMKELVERQRSEPALMYFPKKKYDEGDMMEVRKEWIDHIKPYLKENNGVADMDFDYLKENDGVADMD